MLVRIIGGVPGKLVWVMVGMLVAAFVVWKLRHWWLMHHPEQDIRIKYSRRLAERLRLRRVAQRTTRTRRNARKRARGRRNQG